MKNKQIRYQGKFITIYTYDQQMPDGSFKEFEVWEEGPFVKFFVFNEKREILLINEYWYPVEKKVLRIPGGAVNPNEAPEEAMIRECQEELGVKPNKIQLYAIQEQGYGKERKPKNYAYICSDLTPSKLPHDPGEVIEVVPMSLEKAAALVLDGQLSNDWRGLIFLRIKHDLEQGKIKL